MHMLNIRFWQVVHISCAEKNASKCSFPLLGSVTILCAISDTNTTYSSTRTFLNKYVVFVWKCTLPASNFSIQFLGNNRANIYDSGGVLEYTEKSYCICAFLAPHCLMLLCLLKAHPSQDFQVYVPPHAWNIVVHFFFLYFSFIDKKPPKKTKKQNPQTHRNLFDV